MHNLMANALRALTMDAVEAARSGHPGMPMGMADVATVLFTHFLKFDAKAVDWPDRDRFVLSAGHGSMLLYGLLYLCGVPEFSLEEIKRFRQLGARTAGHPEQGPGIEATTGPLAQGLGNAVGMALAERLLATRFGSDLVDHHTYVILGDGCLMEGLSHEAASLAGHLRLGRLIALYDDNGISIDGPTSLAVSDDTQARFRALGWHVTDIDGHDPEAITAALHEAHAEKDLPSLIVCRTTIGHGSPTKSGSAACHGAPLGAEEIAGARQAWPWPHPPFVIPEAVHQAWLEAGQRGQAARKAWYQRFMNCPEKQALQAAYDSFIPSCTEKTLYELAERLISERPREATRVSSGRVLKILSPVMPNLVGGSADLTGSTNTQPPGATVIGPSRAGNYIHYGIREHAMAAIMNGLALHKGILPYGSTFLVFSDYMRPAIRLAALMNQQVVYIFTHDSIGLGEDGPTHQPVEHLAALRAIPNLWLFRPADAIETVECWAAILQRRRGPSALVLTRQAVEPLYRQDSGWNASARGGYILAAARARHDITLLATGSEVALALRAREQLEAEGIGTQVSSLPCFALLNQASSDYYNKVLGGSTVRLGIEAGILQGWERYIGDKGGFIGMESFGTSGPTEDLFDHFGFTVDHIKTKALALLENHSKNSY